MALCVCFIVYRKVGVGLYGIDGVLSRVLQKAQIIQKRESVEQRGTGRSTTCDFNEGIPT